MKKNRLIIAVSVIILLAVGYVIWSTTMAPWLAYDGRVCVFDDCYFSPGNQKNKYWIDQAVKQKDIRLCNNVGQHDEGDYINSKESYQQYCRSLVPQR